MVRTSFRLFHLRHQNDTEIKVLRIWREADVQEMLREIPERIATSFADIAWEYDEETVVRWANDVNHQPKLPWASHTRPPQFLTVARMFHCSGELLFVAHSINPNILCVTFSISPKCPNSIQRRKQFSRQTRTHTRTAIARHLIYVKYKCLVQLNCVCVFN